MNNEMLSLLMIHPGYEGSDHCQKKIPSKQLIRFTVPNPLKYTEYYRMLVTECRMRDTEYNRITLYLSILSIKQSTSSMKSMVFSNSFSQHENLMLTIIFKFITNYLQQLLQIHV